MATDAAAFRAQPQAWQSVFEDVYGIPTAGRSPYQNWLSQQWQTPAAAFSLGQAGLGAAEAAPARGDTFEQYLRNRSAAVSTQGLGGQYFESLAAMAPQAQRALLETLPAYAPQLAIRGALGERYPSWMAGGLAQQAYTAPAQRAFAISPEGVEGQSFLNFLRSRYGIGAPTASQGARTIGSYFGARQGPGGEGLTPPPAQPGFLAGAQPNYIYGRFGELA
jgi:hypothetical protein